jgi:WD40 repeat protein
VQLRIWNVTDGRVKEWANTPDMITSACFNPEGSMVVAGLYRGQVRGGAGRTMRHAWPTSTHPIEPPSGCPRGRPDSGCCVVVRQVFFYQTEGMRYYTQVECRNRHGALKGGKKVTGLSYDTSTTSSRASQASASEQLLITTNDSRLRLYQTEDYSMLCKYKGLVNDHMQIKASFSEDGAYVISGSENGHVYVWRTTAAPSSGGLSLDRFKKDRNAAYEMFTATDLSGPNPPIVSVALFAPGAAVAQASKGTATELPAAACSSKVIVAADYAGRIRVYHRNCLTKGVGEGVAGGAGAKGYVMAGSRNA